MTDELLLKEFITLFELQDFEELAIVSEEISRRYIQLLNTVGTFIQSLANLDNPADNDNK